MMTLQEEALFNDTSIAIESVLEDIRMINRYDTILVLESGNKSGGLLSKVWNTIKDIIKEAKRIILKTLESINNHARYGLLSKKKKEEYNRFCEWVEKNPEVKQKKISVKKWQQIMAEYDRVEKGIVAAMKDDNVDAKGLNMKAYDLFNSLSDLANSGTAMITVDLAMVLARKSPEMAQEVQKALNHCSKALENVEAQLGEAEVKKLQKNVAKLTKESTFQKIMAMFHQKKEKSLMECMNEVTENLQKLVSEDVSTSDKIKAGIEHRDLIRTGAKAYTKNEDTRKGVKSIIGLKKNIDKNENAQSVIGIAKEFIKPKV